MRTLSSKEVDLVAGGQTTVFIGEPHAYFDRAKAFSDLYRQTTTGFMAGMVGAAPLQVRFLNGIGGGIAGAAFAASNVSSHISMRTPRITISEMGTAPPIGQGGGSD